MVFGGGASGFDLGTAHGRIIIDASGVGAAMSQAQGMFAGGLAGIGQGIASVGRQMQGLGANLSVLTAPIAAFGAAGIATFASFEDAMAEISARTGLTGESLERIKDVALEMGARTQFSAQQAAEAFLQLLSSGQTAEEAIATLPAVLDAAAASGEDLGRTADVVTDIMAAFHLGVGDARMVVDALARAAGASSANMASLGQGFANIGPIAAEFGLSVDQTAAILAIFSENGIKGAEAGTQLRSMLRNMTRDTADVQGMWNRLGISMFTATGQMRPLSDVMRDLGARMATMTQQERLEVLNTLGGAYGQMGLAALTAGMSIEEMQGRMEGQADAADVAAARMGTFNGLMESLKGSIETLMIEGLGPLVETHLKPLIERLIEIVNGVTLWVQQNPELASQIALIAGAVALLGPILVIAGTALTAIGGILALILSPIGLVIAGVAALGAAWVTNFGGIRDVVEPIITRLINILRDIWATVSPGLTAIFNWFMVEGLPRIRAFVDEVVIPAVNRFTGMLVDLWERVQPSLNTLFDWVVNTGLPIIAQAWDTILRPAIEMVVSVLMTLWENVGPILAALFNWFVTYGLPTIGNFIQTVFLPILETFIGVIRNIWEAVRPHLQNLLNGMQRIFAWIGDNILRPVFDFINRIISAVGDAIQRLQELLGLQGQATAGVPAGAEQYANQFIPPGLRDFGGPGMAGMPYLIGTGAQPELFIPDSNGTFIPNADRMMGGQGMQVHIGQIVASGYEAGREAGRGLTDVLDEYYKRGNT